jgi:hypothetical protein
MDSHGSGCALDSMRESTFWLPSRHFFCRVDLLGESDFDRADVDGFPSDSVARRVRDGGVSVRLGPCFDPRTGRLRGAGGPSGGRPENFFSGYLSRLSFIQIGRFDGASDDVLDDVLI